VTDSPRARLPIGPGTRVTLHFSILMPSGDEVDSTWNRRPATFEVGDGNLLPGFERALYGLCAGDTRSLAISPEDGFGMPHPDNVQTLKKDAFPPDLTLEEGLVVSFADAARAEVPGVISRIDDASVEVNFNHPLAGLTLTFDVQIIRVEPVDSDTR